MEFPVAAPVLAAVTGLVALQRMQAVRHYPTDVIAGLVAGAAIGAAATVGIRRLTGPGAEPSALGPFGPQQKGDQDRDQ
jgi:membrane-associated phospholipid phosphatase